MIFVFGSNLAGIHGAGAALYARRHYRAELGVGGGMTGDSYAIPTKDRFIYTLPLGIIKMHVDDFINFAVNNPKLNFKVTKIGCGLANYSETDIAPLFKNAPDNCYLPDGWRNYV